MFCRKCGVSIKQSSHFCTACGTAAAENSSGPAAPPASQSTQRKYTHAEAVTAVHLPGTILQTSAVFTIAGAISWWGIGFLRFVMSGFNERHYYRGPSIEDLILNAVIATVWVGQALIVLVGAGSLKSLKRHSWTTLAMLSALMPCGYCGIVNIPVGIWSLILLMNKSIRAQFKN